MPFTPFSGTVLGLEVRPKDGIMDVCSEMFSPNVTFVSHVESLIAFIKFRGQFDQTVPFKEVL